MSMKFPIRVAAALVLTGMSLIAGAASADDLYRPTTQSLVSDRVGSRVGDTVTVTIIQAAEASTMMSNGSRKSSALSGHLGAGGIDEGFEIGLGGSYDGRGEARRSERFVTQMTATITEVMPNGDLVLAGAQRLHINGEATLVEVRGRVRPVDIDGENRVPSNRIADAQINYNGKGFVSRSARPGLLHRLFSFLGLS